MRKKIYVLLSCFSILGWYSQVLAQEVQTLSQPSVNLFFDQEVNRSHFLLGFESVVLSSKLASVLGYGPKGGFEYGLTESLSLGSNIVFAFQGNGERQGAFFYSGLTGYFRYTWFGSSIKMTDSINQKGRAPIYTGRLMAHRRLAFNLGLEQLFLNGSTSIYPAVGTSFGATWGWIWFGYEVEFEGRICQLVANDNPLSMAAFSANINMDFM